MSGTARPGLYIGLMSGTSLDGVDGVLADLPAAPLDGLSAHGPAPALVRAHAHLPFPAALRAELLALQHSDADELQRAALAAHVLADLYADVVGQLLAGGGVRADQVSAIGAHGQTVRHRPELGYTLQLNAPARLAELCGIDVIADLRSRDVAAGGQGAPLVPALHAGLFGRAGLHRVVVNIGGMANLTDLPGTAAAPVRGWDTGPGNCLLDHWIGKQHGLPYDDAGAWAAQGQVIPGLLAGLLKDGFFAAAPPKSTGRDQFNPDWLTARLAGHAPLAAVDVQSSLAELTATTIASAITQHCAGAREVIVCGGGARNADLLERLRRLLNTAPQTGRIAVTRSDDHGLPADQVEALAFAWLAQCHVSGLPGNLASVTGARGPRILGARYPA